MPSLQVKAAPPTQLPPLQASLVVHAFPSSHEAVFGTPQVPEPSHTSSVHGLPSGVHGVPDPSKHDCVASVQVALHSPLHGLPLPTQVPAPSHWSVEVQNCPSSHGVPLGATQSSLSSLQVLEFAQVPTTARGSDWAGDCGHGLPLLTQDPSMQLSSPLQNSPSSQEALLAGCVQVPDPSHWSSVHTFPSSGHGSPFAS